MQKKKKENNIVPSRMDFVQEIISTEDIPGGGLHYQARVFPDPKRYDKYEEDGETYYKDKYTEVIIPLKVLVRAVESAKFPIPIYHSPAKVEKYCDIKSKFREDLESDWNRNFSLPEPGGKIAEYLNQYVGKDMQFVIIYVDLEGSTELSFTYDSETNAKLIKIFLMNMAKIIDNFRGYVLKYVGDCAIGIFPAEGNLPGMCDNALEASMMMCAIIEEVINPIFAEKGLPKIGCHIGLDMGKLRIDNFIAENSANFVDLIGYPMNLTAKIQSKAGHNEILLGRYLYENLHHTRMDFVCEVKDSEKWGFVDPYRGTPYKIYRVKYLIKFPESCS